MVHPKSSYKSKIKKNTSKKIYLGHIKKTKPQCSAAAPIESMQLESEFWCFVCFVVLFVFCVLYKINFPSFETASVNCSMDWGNTIFWSEQHTVHYSSPSLPQDIIQLPLAHLPDSQMAQLLGKLRIGQVFLFTLTDTRHEREFPFPTFSQEVLVNSFPTCVGNTFFHSCSQSQNLAILFFIPIPNSKIWEHCFQSNSQSQILRKYIENFGNTVVSMLPFCITLGEIYLK